MEELIRGVILGLIQGVTEFFPVSSSGHLIFVPRLFGWEDQGLAFDTILHVGTLGALLWVFRDDIRDAITKSRRLLAMVLVASLPGITFGGLLSGIIEENLRAPQIVAFGLAFWAIVLLIADQAARKRKTNVTDSKDLHWWQAILIGFSQAIALIPGTSRSGITMTGGLFSGLERSTAVTFSFLVSIPTLAAAGGYGIWKFMQNGVTVGGGLELGVGFVVAAVSGAWAIQFLRSYVTKHSFLPFIMYRLALATIIFAMF